MVELSIETIELLIQRLSSNNEVTRLGAIGDLNAETAVNNMVTNESTIQLLNVILNNKTVA